MWDDDYERPERYETRRVYVIGGPGLHRAQHYSPQQVGTFSGTEIWQLLVAFGVLTVAFTFLFTDGIFVAMYIPALFIFFLPLALIAVATAFLCHELGHKFLAQKYGYWAEFRYNLMFLLIGVGMAAMFGFLFVGPGAVMIAGNPTRSENGKLSAAGPGINIAFAAIFAAVAFIFHAYWYMIYLALVVGMVNVIIAGFNMMPFWIFDGAKIWRWSPGIYIGMWVPIVLLAIFHFGIYYGLLNIPQLSGI